MKRIKLFLIAAVMITSLCASATAFAASSPVGGGVGVSSPVGGGVGVSSPVGGGVGVSSPVGGGVGVSSPVGGGVGVSDPVGGDDVIHNPQPPSDGGWKITDVYGAGIPKGLICVQQPLSVEEGLKLTAAVQSAIRSRNITVKNQFMINLSLMLNGQPYDQQGKPITFTMLYSGVRPWDKALIVHIKHDGSVELIDAVCGYDQISFTLTSLSPLALLITQGASPVDSSATNTTVLSPKTDGGADMSYAWYIVAAAAAVSVIGVRKLVRKR